MSAIIFEQKEIVEITPAAFDQLWSKGWRHFGKQFFRYNLTLYEGELCRVQPLRIQLSDYQHRKSHQKILRRASRFKVHCRPLNITGEMQQLFQEHKQKFVDNVPDSIYTFLSYEPEIPQLPMECAVYDGERLIAVSFFDIGKRAVSSIYGMFDLGYGKYSLGTLTMLKEIEYAVARGMDYYYHGYCYDRASFYDYKKGFPALESYNWAGKWLPYANAV